MGVCDSKNDVPDPQPSQENVVQPAEVQELAQPSSENPSALHQLYEAVCPTDADHMELESAFDVLLQIKHPNNLNNRYTYMYKVDETKFVGKDLRRTNAYISRIPLEMIKKRREEFWETRIEAVKSTWEALRFACESDELETSLALLNAAGVKLFQKNLQMSYDKENFRYDIPIFVINDPSSYIEEKKSTDLVDKQITIKVWMAFKEHQVVLSTKSPCSVLVDKLQELQLPELTGKALKPFHSGKEMKLTDELGQYTTDDDDAVVTIFLRDQTSS